MKNKILLISGSNPLKTPFIGFYQNILQKCNVDYDVLFWNRDKNDTTHFDGKYISYNMPIYIYANPLKKIIACYRFYCFAKKKIRKGKYDKIICFTISSSIFFQGFLKRHFNNKYIFDIRDHSSMIENSYFKCVFKRLIAYSYCTIISSKGFISWLPNDYNYIISHNIDSSLLFHNSLKRNGSKKIKILTIGFFVRFEPNSYLIKDLKNYGNVTLSFVGYGPYYSEYENYCKSNHIYNTEFKGRYSKEEELVFYDDCDMVNILLTHNLNSDTCMSNRFYNSVVCRKPMIVNSGCYQAEIVSKYKLGVVIENYEHIGEQIIDYYKGIDWNEYYRGCEAFIKEVESENQKFKNKVVEFTRV